ncbi:MAG: hypothetical protein SGPRY_012079 [Prymnesium sp.]
MHRLSLSSLILATSSLLAAEALQAYPTCTPPRASLRSVAMIEREDLMLEDDLFAIVGTSPDAGPTEIRRAFHRQARRLHPDYNPGPESAREFRRLVVAFETLSDPQKRFHWEQMRSSRLRRSSFVAEGPQPSDYFSTRPSTSSSDEMPLHSGSLRTWSYNSPAVEEVMVVLTTDDETLDAEIELWHGPDQTPCTMRLQLGKGDVRPFTTVLRPLFGPHTVAIRNIGNDVESTLSARLIAWDVESPSDKCVSSTVIIEGASIRTYPLEPYVESVEAKPREPSSLEDAERSDGHRLLLYIRRIGGLDDLSVASVQILVTNEGCWALDARIELLLGGSLHKQFIDLYTEDGCERPFYCIIETPGTGNAVRVVNTAVEGFPMVASVVPLTIDEDLIPPPALGNADGIGKNIDRLKGREAELKAEVSSIGAQEMAKPPVGSLGEASAGELGGSEGGVSAEEVTVAIRVEMEKLLDLGERTRAAGREADAARQEARLREVKLKREADETMAEFVAKTEAGLEEVAALRVELEEVAAVVQGGELKEGESPRAQTEMLLLELEETSAAADAIRLKMESRLQAAYDARYTARAGAVRRYDAPRDALRRRERRRQVQMSREALDRLSDFVAKTEATLDSVNTLRLELVDIMDEIEESEAAHYETEVMRMKQEVTVIMEDSLARMIVRLQAAREARESFITVEEERQSLLDARANQLKKDAQALRSVEVREPAVDVEVVHEASVGMGVGTGVDEAKMTNQDGGGGMEGEAKGEESETGRSTVEAGELMDEAVAPDEVVDLDKLQRRQAELKAQAQDVAAQALEDAEAAVEEAAELRDLIGSFLDEAMADVEAVRIEMGQRLPGVVEAWRPLAKAEAEAREEKQIRLDALKARVEAIAAVVEEEEDFPELNV